MSVNPDPHRHGKPEAAKPRQPAKPPAPGEQDDSQIEAFEQEGAGIAAKE